MIQLPYSEELQQQEESIAAKGWKRRIIRYTLCSELRKVEEKYVFKRGTNQKL